MLSQKKSAWQNGIKQSHKRVILNGKLIGGFKSEIYDRDQRSYQEVC